MGFRKRRRRWLPILIVGAIAALLVLKIASSEEAPDPPIIDLHGMEPRVASAISSAREAVLDQPESAAAWATLGMFLDVHDLFEEAACCYDVAAKLDPQEFRWPYMLAMCLPESDPVIQIEALLRARALKQGYPPLEHRLARLYLATGHRQKAREHFETILATQPENSHALWGLARLALDADEVDTSLSLLQRAANSAPGHREVQALLAQVLARRGDAEQAALARQRAESMTGSSPFPDPLRLEVQTHGRSAQHMLFFAAKAMAEGRPRDAVVHLIQVLEVRQGDPLILMEYRRAKLAAQMQDSSRNPRDATLRQELMNLLAEHANALAMSPDPRLRNGLEALSAAEELLRLGGDGPRALSTLAAAYAELGRYEDAASELQKAVQSAAARGDHAFAKRVHERLSSYRAGKPWYGEP